METKSGDANMPVNDDFEPRCDWEREEPRVTLIIDVEGFKMEHLKVKFSAGILTICGERPEIETKKSRFQKQICISKGFKPGDIRATLVGSRLRISMPLSAEHKPSYFKFSLKSLAGKVGIVVVGVGLVVYGAYFTCKYWSCVN